ncbi:MAG: hypothetical protein V4726_15790 [Verrucomicrobiota bacterium]
MSDPHFPPRVSWTRRLSQRWRGLLREPLSSAGAVCARPVRQARAFAGQAWGLGVTARVCLLILLALTTVTAGVMPRNGGGFPLLQPASGILVTGLAGLVWAAACAAAASLPLWGFGLAGFWLAYHGLLLMASWAGTPVMPLPVLWVLAVGLAVGSRRGTPRGWPEFLTWLGLCLGAGYFMSGPLGLNALPGVKGAFRDWAGAVLLAAVFAPAWRLRPWFRRRRWAEPSFGRVLAGSAAVIGLGLTASGFRSFEGTMGWAAAVMDTCGYAAMLAWFWLAGGFAVSLLNLMECGTRLAVRGLTLRVVRRIFPFIWAVVTIVEWLGSHESAVPWMDRIGPGRLDHWMASWPWEIRVAAWGHAWAGVAALTAGAGFLWQGREGVRLMPRLHSLWISSFFCILAISPVLAAYISPVPEHAGRIWWWAPLLLLGGIFQDMVQAGRNWHGETGEGLPARLGWRMVMLGVLLAMECRNALPWPGAGGAAALLGMLHLALPRALHHWWTRGRTAAGLLPVSSQIWISAAGMVSVLPMLNHNPQSTGVLAFAPVLWLPVLLWLRCRRPGLAASSGALAGALLGSSTVAAWCRPGLLLPDVPLLSFLNAPLAATSGAEALANRPFLDATHFSLLLLLTSTGAVLGAIVFRCRPPAGEIPIAIAEPAA